MQLSQLGGEPPVYWGLTECTLRGVTYRLGTGPLHSSRRGCTEQMYGQPSRRIWSIFAQDLGITKKRHASTAKMENYTFDRKKFAHLRPLTFATRSCLTWSATS